MTTGVHRNGENSWRGLTDLQEGSPGVGFLKPLTSHCHPSPEVFKYNKYFDFALGGSRRTEGKLLQ